MFIQLQADPADPTASQATGFEIVSLDFLSGADPQAVGPRQQQLQRGNSGCKRHWYLH